MKVLEGTINSRAREARDTGDEGDTPSPQLFGIDGGNKVLLSLIQMGEQRCILLLKLILFAHAGSITQASSCVTINFLRALSAEPNVFLRRLVRMVGDDPTLMPVFRVRGVQRPGASRPKIYNNVGVPNSVRERRIKWGPGPVVPPVRPRWGRRCLEVHARRKTERPVR
jgi:hypothetical protein